MAKTEVIMRVKISDEYLNLRFSYCNQILNSLPRVFCGIHRGVPVLRTRQRSKDGRFIVKEVLVSSKKASAFKEIDLLRKKLSQEIKTLKNTKGVDPKVASRMKVARSGNMNGEFFKSLVAESNSRSFKSNYSHKGIQMRSRAELLVAEVLDELNLQYKYEPAIEFNGTVYNPDFIVYIEAIDSCFIIEVLGMTDNPDYWYKNVPKFADYARSGLLINGELLLIAGTESHIPDTDDIYNSIVGMINLAVWRALA